MRNLYAIHVLGFPESYAELFLTAALNSMDGEVLGDPITHRKYPLNTEPTHRKYGVFFMTMPSDPTALARYIAARLRRYMTGRGNDPNAGSYAVTVALLNAHNHNPEAPEFPAVGYYDEAIHGYL